jgi:hypothetical protein
MARLPVLHRRRSKTQQALDLAKGAAKLWTAAKATSVGARMAKQSAKVARRRPSLKLMAVPAAVAGGAIAWRAAHKGGGERESDFDRPLGPVATADTVSPPADAAAEAAKAESASS